MPNAGWPADVKAITTCLGIRTSGAADWSLRVQNETGTDFKLFAIISSYRKLKTWFMVLRRASSTEDTFESGLWLLV